MRTWSEDHPKARLLERKQRAIKEAARRLFLQHGYAMTTMEMVAAEAGVSIMTLYRHFRGKDVLFQSIITPLCCEPHSPEDCESLQTMSAEDMLTTLGLLKLEQLLDPEELALYRVILSSQEHFPEAGVMYEQLLNEHAVRDVEWRLEHMRKRGLLSCSDTHQAASIFLALLTGQIMERARLRPEHVLARTELEAHVRERVQAFLSIYPAHIAPYD